jgi:hypothetical protein
MKYLAAILLACLWAVPAQAHDPQIIDDVLSTISRFAHHYQPEPEYDEEGPEGPPSDGVNHGPQILQWLDANGHPDALVVGRRDADCPQPSTFRGGWGVVFKGRKGKPISGVVCVDAGIGPRLSLDR